MRSDITRYFLQDCGLALKAKSLAYESCVFGSLVTAEMGVFLISCVSTSLKLLTWSLYFTVSCILIRSGAILASVADTPARKPHHMALGVVGMQRRLHLRRAYRNHKSNLLHLWVTKISMKLKKPWWKLWFVRRLAPEPVEILVISRNYPRLFPRGFYQREGAKDNSQDVEVYKVWNFLVEWRSRKPPPWHR